MVRQAHMDHQTVTGLQTFGMGTGHRIQTGHSMGHQPDIGRQACTDRQVEKDSSSRMRRDPTVRLTLLHHSNRTGQALTRMGHRSVLLNSCSP